MPNSIHGNNSSDGFQFIQETHQCLLGVHENFPPRPEAREAMKTEPAA